MLHHTPERGDQQGDLVDGVDVEVVFLNDLSEEVESGVVEATERIGLDGGLRDESATSQAAVHTLPVVVRRTEGTPKFAIRVEYISLRYPSLISEQRSFDCDHRARPSHLILVPSRLAELFRARLLVQASFLLKVTGVLTNACPHACRSCSGI